MKTNKYTYLRGIIRRAWSKSKLKIEFIRSKRHKKLLGKKGKPVFGAQCNICKKDYLLSQMQVDHINGNISLKSDEDIVNFINSILFCTHNDLQMLCKQCHKTKTVKERYNLNTWQEALDFQKLAAFKKLKAQEQKDFLRENLKGIKGIEKSNKQQREELYKTYLETEILI